MKVWIRALVLGLLIAIGVALPATATESFEPVGSTPVVPRVMGVDDFEFDSLSVEYYLGRDADGHSTLRTVEHFVAVFPDIDQNRGIRRIIPDQFNGWPTDLEVISVTDEYEQARPMEVEREDGAVQITSRANSFLHGEQHFIITYEQRNVTRYFADTGVDEFYWDVNGEDWAQPFGTVGAKIIFEDRELAQALNLQNLSCYVGFYGSTETCEIYANYDANNDGSPDSVFAEHDNLQPRQTMTIAIGFEAGTFTPRADGVFNTWTGQVMSVLGAIGTLFMALLGWFRATLYRDTPGRGTIIPEYAPEPGLSAIFAAVFLGRSPQLITAGLLDNAVQHRVQLLEESEDGFFGSKSRYGVLMLEKEPELAEDATFLTAIFSTTPRTPGATHWFRKNSDTVSGGRMTKLLSALGREVKTRALRDSKRWLKYWPIPVIGFVLSVGLAFFAIVNLSEQIAMGFSIVALVIAVLLFLMILVICFRSPLTREGSLLKEHLEGLKLYISVAEADRIRVLQSVSGAERADYRMSDALPDAPISFDDSGRPNPAQVVQLYERLLPYAVIFGLEKSWTQVLGDYYEQLHVQPYWYHGSTPFQAAALGAALTSITSTTSASFGSSSSSGGSSGGGSAGGGGGGGGGGGV